jgi:hypothetical protein
VRNNGTVVFRSETIAEGHGADSAALNERANHNENKNNEYSDSNDKLGLCEVVTH